MPVLAPATERTIRTNIALLVGLLALAGSNVERDVRASRLRVIPSPLRQLGALTVAGAVLPLVVVGSSLRR